MYNDKDLEGMCAITEQGDLGLGINKPQNDQEREALRKKLEEMTQATNDTNKRN